MKIKATWPVPSVATAIARVFFAFVRETPHWETPHWFLKRRMVSCDMKESLVDSAQSDLLTSDPNCVSEPLSGCKGARLKRRRISTGLSFIRNPLFLGVAALVLTAIPLKAIEFQTSGVQAELPDIKMVGDSFVDFGKTEDSAFGNPIGWASGSSKEFQTELQGDGNPPIILPVVPPYLPYLHRCKDASDGRPDGRPFSVPDGDSGTAWSFVVASLLLFGLRSQFWRMPSRQYKTAICVEESRFLGADVRPISMI